MTNRAVWNIEGIERKQKCIVLHIVVWRAENTMEKDANKRNDELTQVFEAIEKVKDSISPDMRMMQAIAVQSASQKDALLNIYYYGWVCGQSQLQGVLYRPTTL